MKPILRLLFVLGLLVCSPSALAQSLSGVVISAGSGQAQILIAEEPVPGTNARLTVAQNEILGASTASGLATVTATDGSVITIETESPLKAGPVIVQIIEDGDTATGGGVGLDGAVGMSVGDLKPNFTLPGADGVAQADGAGDLGRILPLVREWIALAEPPDNAKPGYRLKYSNWAQIYGSTPTGTITLNAKPDNTGGLDYDMYLWTRYPDLPSLNHCSLRDFVTAKLAGTAIDGCRGRSPALETVVLADFTGQTLGIARRALGEKQLKVAIRPGDPAPSGALEKTVLTQAPRPGTAVEPGQTVTLTVYSDYVVPAGTRAQIEAALGSCRFEQANSLIAAIDTDTARAPFTRLYGSAFQREEKTRDLFNRANALYRACDFSGAQAKLSEAARNTGCERYRTKIADSLQKIAAASSHAARTATLLSDADRLIGMCDFKEAQARLDDARRNSQCPDHKDSVKSLAAKIGAASTREARTKILFSEANRLFGQKDFSTALTRLEAAKANTRCERYVTRINEALAKVQGHTEQAGAGTFEVGVDRMGGDYRSFWLPRPEPALCQKQCEQEEQCRAWTYVVPGHQGSQAKCWLKSRVPNPRNAQCCVSGVKTGAKDTRPSADGASAPETPSGPVDPSYFAGTWGLSRNACTGSLPPPETGPSDIAPGSVGDAVAEGIGKAVETIISVARMRFADTGELYMVLPGGEAHPVGNWRVENGYLITSETGKSKVSRARVLERRPNQVSLVDPTSGDTMIMYRCR
ncbi:PAN domain-containing protein [Roseibium aggregatum]|uniref:PASTA domain-containing protein n=1 Tax=Roseibium aggregatum TaxID=187304 RepID=A0A939EC87_9HYPH|nr:PAN domain-containing protein [Roseibium aggregatum]MBN9670086.1 PASTA domain-containing protein [Roseibium aggregatum]